MKFEAKHIRTDELVRGERIKKAEDFLQSVLHPRIKSNGNITEQELVDLINQYKKEHPGLGNDFETSTVIGRVLVHFHEQPAEVIEDTSKMPESVKLDIKTLKILSGFDIRKIDKKINERD